MVSSGFAERGALAEEATILMVPSVGKRVIDEHPGHALGLLAGFLMEHFVGFQHQVGRLNVVSVGIVIGNRLPGVCEVEIHDARLDADLVADDGEQLFQPRAESRIGPDLVELSECLQQVNMRIHRLVVDGPDWVRCYSSVGNVRHNRCSIASEPFKIPAIHGVMRVLVGP